MKSPRRSLILSELICASHQVSQDAGCSRVSAWRWTEHFKNQTGLSALACERIGLSGLTTAPFLALFTAPPSQRATTSRYCALRRCSRSAALIAPSTRFLSCQERESQRSSLSCPEKKRVKQPFYFHVDLPQCQHPQSP